MEDDKSLHDFLMSHVEQDLRAFLGAEGINDEQLYHILFINYRRDLDGTQHGVRLSPIGHKVMSNHFAAIPMDHGLPHVNHSIMIALDKKMIWPYHINKSHIYMYSDTDATWFALESGTLKEFLESI